MPPGTAAARAANAASRSWGYGGGTNPPGTGMEARLSPGFAGPGARTGCMPHLHPRAAEVLRPVHRDVGTAQQLRRGLGTVGGEHQTDARRGDERPVVERHR